MNGAHIRILVIRGGEPVRRTAVSNSRRSGRGAGAGRPGAPAGRPERGGAAAPAGRNAARPGPPGTRERIRWGGVRPGADAGPADRSTVHALYGE